ncbi:chorismate-binding protein [Streptomyces sp. NBC_00690]|uniref:chorismate-binding protein n=1 Tax=Streptomyces sp. NBC_00690 TaxID=2975808 RepID=UPI002E2C0BFC|nr:chorismate-binding protein [Streptomyces sp. NBC_00690]
MTGGQPHSRPPHAGHTDTDVLQRVLDGQAQAFALLHRPSVTGPDAVEVVEGSVTFPTTLADIPLPPAPGPQAGEGAQHDVLVIVPYRQLIERGFACADDGTPLVAMTITRQQQLPLAEALPRLPSVPTRLADGDFDVDDQTYEEAVRSVIKEMIGTGEGSSFVIKRTFVADITDYGAHSAPALFRRLVERESGAHWTFLIHTGTRTLVGASPERHVSLHHGIAVMNPISGTYRYPPSGPTLEGVLEFLRDRKETDELYMVLDEELKMMGRICDRGGRVIGPQLREMAQLAHTEYLIEGATDHDVRDILRETMFAPTVTGSPLESACRIIRKYEPGGRGYYSGAVALIGRDAYGSSVMDSAILIRTADISTAGRVGISVGATIVRHSDPGSEAAETRAKAAGLLAAFNEVPRRFAGHPSVRKALEQRNAPIGTFWLSGDARQAGAHPQLAGRRAIVVDAEDAFTSMLDQQLRSLGLEVTVRRFDEDCSLEGYDFVVMGPGPGDPQDQTHPKMRYLDATVETLLRRRQPFFSVCLSHQILGLRLGLPLRQKAAPSQGVHREIDLFGATERVGFYNTFALTCEGDAFIAAGVGLVRVSRDAVNGEVHALRGPGFASMQFHPESVLTQGGPRIVGAALADVLASASSMAG